MATENAQVKVNEQTVENVEIVNPVNNTNDVEVIGTDRKTYNEIIKDISNNGGRRFNGLRVKNVKTEVNDNYTRVTFVVDKPIPASIVDTETGEYTKGFINNIFTSTFALAGMIKENADLAWMGDIISRIGTDLDDEEAVKVKPEFLNLLFCGAEIDIIQQHIEADKTYINPFTTRNDSEGTTKDYDWYANNIISVKLSKSGKRAAERLADKVMGF